MHMRNADIILRHELLQIVSLTLTHKSSNKDCEISVRKDPLFFWVGLRLRLSLCLCPGREGNLPMHFSTTGISAFCAVLMGGILRPVM